MSALGTVYGVILNVRQELERLGDALTRAPYGKPPEAPVLYIKPPNTVLPGGGDVPAPADVEALQLGATLALLIFAGEVIRPFSWIMAFGVFTGTFSSIYVAGPLLLWIEHKWPRSTDGTNKGQARALTEERKRERAPAGVR